MCSMTGFFCFVCLSLLSSGAVDFAFTQSQGGGRRWGMKWCWRWYGKLLDGVSTAQLECYSIICEAFLFLFPLG